jgi:hypothetical protein
VLVCRLTIVGGGRDALVVGRRGREEIVRPRRLGALLGGPSTSPLESAAEFNFSRAKEELEKRRPSEDFEEI